jgi:hypothetical protein
MRQKVSGKTQAELANLMAVTQGAISQLEGRYDVLLAVAALRELTFGLLLFAERTGPQRHSTHEDRIGVDQVNQPLDYSRDSPGRSVGTPRGPDERL